VRELSSQQACFPSPAGQQQLHGDSKQLGSTSKHNLMSRLAASTAAEQMLKTIVGHSAGSTVQMELFLTIKARILLP
jgi:hypothetical protein